MFPDDSSIRVEVHIDLTDVAEGSVLDGVMRVSGHLPGGFEPFETRFRFEFYDESDGRTRLEVRQWLPAEVTGATEAGWRQSFVALDELLAKRADVSIRATAPRRTNR